MKLSRSITILALVASLALLIGLTVSGPTAAQETETAFTIDGPTELAVGDEATYTVRVAAPVELYSAEVLIDYPADSADVTAVENGAFLSQDAGSLVAAAGADNGVITYAESRSSTQNGITGEGILVRITVEFTEPGTHEFAFLDAQARDPDINPIATSASGHTIEIADGDAESSGGDETSASTSGSGSENTEDGTDSTQDVQTKDANEWPPVVDESVQNALEDADSVRVLATTTEPENLADRIRERGGNEVTPLPTASVVAFTGDAELIRWVAGDNRVTLVQYDETVTTQSTTVVETVTVEPDEVTVNTPVTVQVVLTTDAATKRTEDITLTVDGTVIEERTVTVENNTNKTVAFTLIREEPGDYVVEVNDRAATMLSVTEPTGNSTSTEEQLTTEPTDDEVPGFTVTLTLIAVLIGVTVVRYRQNSS